jgi:hypothetical protein
MTSLKLCRCAAAVVLVGGVFLALPGCNKPPAENKDDKKEKKEQPGEPKGGNPGGTGSDNKGSGSPVLPAQPAKVDINSGVGKEAVDFLQAVKAGMAKADQLSASFTRLIGLPAELPSDKAKGYSTDAAADWLRHVGGGVGFGLPLQANQAGDVALFRGALVGKPGSYCLRMVKEGPAWKVDWLSASSVEVKGGPAAPPGNAEAMFQEFAATAVFEAVCDKDAMGKEERTAIIAAGLTPALRAKWGPPFDGDKAKGYDYNPAQLAIEAGKIGGGAESVSFVPQGEAAFRAEVTRAGGAKATYLVKLAKGGTPGQWLVESITPQ